MKGKFITLEGCDGSGKSLQKGLLEKYFTDKGIPFLMTREPGGTDFSEKIRSIIMSTDTVIDGRTELLLYTAARAEHLYKKIIPALEEDKTVICDRYFDSSVAYQGYARDLGAQRVKNLHNIMFDEYLPDLTLFLDISPKDAFFRKGGADKNDRMEKENLDFHQKVYNGYLELLKDYPDRIVRIDAKKSPQEINKDIIKEIEKRFFKK